jgi:MFS family permease
MSVASDVGQPQVKNRGWIVTLSATIALLMLGALYAWSVVSKAMADDALGRYDQWSEADKVWPYSICLIFFSVMTAVGGRIQDKRGPRIMIMTGGVFAGAGMIVCGLSPNPLVWYLGFGVLLGTGIGLAYSSGTPPSVKWFPASKTGLISGLVVAGFGGGAVWVAPTLRSLIGSYGIPTTMIMFGIAVVVVMNIFAQFVKAPPPGYVPVETTPKAGAPAKPKKVVTDYSPDSMIRTWQFPIMIACFAFGGGAGLVFIGKMASIITSFGFEAYSAIAVSVLALGNGIGRVLYGKLSDNFGRRPVLVFALAFQAVLLVVLAMWPVADYTLNEAGKRVFMTNESMGTLVLLLVLSWFIGANYGANLAVFPAMTKDFFGLKSFGLNYGLVYQGWGIGGFIVSQIGAYLIAARSDSTNIYLWAYYWVIALLVIGVGLMLMLRAPKQNEIIQEPTAKPTMAAAKAD